MDALEAAVTGSCPLAFAGASGPLFVRAVTAMVAAHCSIVDHYAWPEDEAEKVFLKAKENPKFYFIVVGAGTAGSIVASRLSDNLPLNSVLLIEAGDDPGLESEVPALLFHNQDKKIDWHYQTYADGRSCLGFYNNSCIWSKGRAMGGSSSINAMLYIRGHPKDYNKWEQEGAWSYRDLEPYFNRIEHKLKIQDCKNNDNFWYEIIKSAWKELDFDFENNSNEAKSGTRLTKLLTRHGKRLNTAKVYMNRNTNLHVMKNTVVQKLIIDYNTKIASGVEVRYSNGKIIKIGVNKEVILSAGSVATPQLLMLSGIGPKEHLENNKIECLIDLPVGKNLQDHIILPIFLTTNLHTVVTWEKINSFFLQYMSNRTGPFSSIGITDFMGFIDTDDSNNPNIQFHHTYFTQNDSFTLQPYLKGVGYTKEIIAQIEDFNKQSDLLGIYPTLLHPKSRGEILLADNKPLSKPIIKPYYLNEIEDLNSLLKGVNFIKRLSETSDFKTLSIKLAFLKIPSCSTFSLDSDNYWKCYIENMATTIYHPVGTAKMGSKHDNGVVTKHLLVHGMGNVRVVDASVMPLITSGNTMAPTMVIAEKAADIISNTYRFRDEL